MVSASARGMGYGFPISCLSIVIMSVLLIYSVSEKEHEVDSNHIYLFTEYYNFPWKMYLLLYSIFLIT